jgi:hypothetical protein
MRRQVVLVEHRPHGAEFHVLELAVDHNGRLEAIMRTVISSRTMLMRLSSLSWASTLGRLMR